VPKPFGVFTSVSFQVTCDFELWKTGSAESSFEEAAKPTPVQALQRLEHCELVMGEDGKPVELGRGAMEVTYV
jgi:hypothetical protein